MVGEGCECNPAHGEPILECTYPKCPFGEWEGKQQPDYRPPVCNEKVGLDGVVAAERCGLEPGHHGAHLPIPKV